LDDVGGRALADAVSWRSTVVIIGACGVAAAVAIAILMPRFGAENAPHDVKAAEEQNHPPQRLGLHCCSPSV
jgi:predicted MFS family arabinose efflux permease